MHLELDAAQRALRDSSRALARSLPTEGHPELADATLAAFRAAGLSLPLAPEPVGRGLSLLDTCLHLEAVAEERPSAAATL
ncbi:MAG: hypothetical protein FJ098_10410, partial [Deltaproteobacteria bacterium]|nr:hypothetical protein [Deltaproteobacteria bacterium]